jgi:hypothetical protein
LEAERERHGRFGNRDDVVLGGLRSVGFWP